LELAADGRQLIVHVHELAYACELLVARESLRQAAALRGQFVAASVAVQQFLHADLGIPEASIHVVHEFPVAEPLAEPAAVRGRTEFRKRLGIADDLPVIGMCGSVEWRKGADLFVQLARVLKARMGLNFRCVWLGGNHQQQLEARHDLRQLALEDVCQFIPATVDPRNFYSALDIFCLTSREDPFSIAMLEAAAHGVPIICFSGAGGAPELVEHDAGMVVPYLDLRAMADACEQLAHNPAERQRRGAVARTKVQTKYCKQEHVRKISDLLRHAFTCG
jgi:glycosyltransferase involved in cell wall biosynthesis